MALLDLSNLEGFAKKADNYRAALDSVPDARAMEILPFASFLIGMSKKLGIPRSQLMIVDLMSGSGYLSEQLFQLGFKNIIAIESCNEMSYGSEIYKSIRLVSTPSIDEALEEISAIRPHIVMSLASFHHLIKYDSNGNIDTGASIELQAKVIRNAVNALAEGGAVIIGDLSEVSYPTQISEELDDTWSLDVKSGIRLLPESTKKLDGIKKIFSASKIGDYVDATYRVFPNGTVQDDHALSWFRDIVDVKTDIGHKDVALNQELVNLVRSQSRDAETVTTFRYWCPWVFPSADHLKNFIFQKFAFCLNENGSRIRAEDVVGLADSKHLIGTTGDTSYFRWELGMLVVKRENSIRLRESIATANILLIGLVSILLITLISKVAVGFDPIGTGFLLQNLIGFFVGGLLTVLASSIITKIKSL